MPSRYYYGPSVKSNEVKASTARTFRSLVQQHLEGVIRLRLTQAEYAALETGRERLDAKDTTYLVACTYESQDAYRGVDKNPLLPCNLLFLDLDEEPDGKCPAAPFARSPEILTKSLEPFNFAAYTTASSTPAKPRMRIVVDAEAIPLRRYTDAVRTIADLLGLKHVTKESLVPNQPMICPSLFQDQDEDMDHPLLISGVKGRSFTVEDIREVKLSDKAQIATMLPEAGVSDDEDGLEYLRAPLAGITLERVTEALDRLNPDMRRKEWLDIACALRHQFAHDEEEAEKAFELFDTWSSKSQKYPGQDGPEGTIYQWNSVKATPRGRVPVTIRTLIKRATDAGWSAGELKDECFEAVLDWIAHSAKTRDDFTRVALEKIAGLPMLSVTEEDMLLSAVRAGLKESRGETVKQLSLAKDLKKIQSAKERSREGAAEIQEKPCFKGWCYVTTEESFFRSSSHQKMSGEAFNCAYGRYLIPSEEQLEKAGKEVNEATLNTPLYAPKDYLLNHRQCLVVDGYDYDPAHPKDIYTEDDQGVRLVNTYRKSYPKPCFKTAEKAGSAIKIHLKHLIAEEEYRLVIMDYIAYMVQFPGRKIRWCPLIQGAEGCGKTLMARILEAVLGKDNVALVNNDGIRSQWNDWAFGAQVVVIPEAYVAGKAKMETMNRLKDLVTDDRISITKRNNSVRTVTNRSNYLMFTNHHDALVLMVGSRRYFIIKSPLQTEEQVLALGDGYFEKLFKVINEQAAGLRGFFESWDISDSFPADGRAPKTKYLEQMIEDAAGEETAAVRRIIRSGSHPLVQADLLSSTTLRLLLEIEGVRCSHQSLAAVLRAENYNVAEGNGVTIDGTLEHLWVKAGRFVKQDVGAIARHRHETKYTTSNEEDWV